MKLKAITANEAKKATIQNGYCWTPDGRKTYYAINENGEIYEYETKAERDRAVNKTND